MFLLFMIFFLLLFSILSYRTIYRYNNYLILLFGDLYYIDIIRNLYINIIIKYNLQHIFIVATASKEAYYKYLSLHIPAVLMFYNISNYQENTNIISKHFVKKMHIRTYILYYYLIKGISLIHIDADTYYFINPLYLYKMKQKSDIAFACNDFKCNELNTGYMYIINRNYSF